MDMTLAGAQSCIAVLPVQAERPRKLPALPLVLALEFLAGLGFVLFR